MSTRTIQVESGAPRSIIEFGDPLPVEDEQPQDEGSCRFCVPFRTLVTLEQFDAVPSACLPLPEGATILCPQIEVICTTGVPVALDTWRVGVPLRIAVPAHTVTILSPDGAVLCTAEAAPVAFRPTQERITCPVTEGVTCTCRVSPITCQGCSFEFGGELFACRFRFTLMIDCMSCPPVRGLGGIATTL